MATAKRFKNEIKDDKIVSSKAPTKNTVSADAGSKGARYIPYDEAKTAKKEVVPVSRPRNVADKEISNYGSSKKTTNVNLPRDIPALSAKTKAPEPKAPTSTAPVKVASKASATKTSLPAEESSNPVLRRAKMSNDRLPAVKSNSYGTDSDVATQARIDEAADFFKKRGVGATTELAKGGAVSLKPITGKALKPLSSKSITQAAKGMQKAVKPARPAKGFATGGAVKCSKSSKAIDGCAKKGLTRAARAK